jgi:GNAT superfamily N-acetyltransferase
MWQPALVLNVRMATGDDAAFLEQMLAIAADWRPGSAPRPAAEVMADPDLARYVIGWPRVGDVGVVACDDDQPVGAAWWRYFTDDDRGYGFVASDVPEVSIGVVDHARGRGIGGALMARLIEEARARSVTRLGLSVEVDNPARRLYERLGFRRFDEANRAMTGSGAVTMLLEVS